MSGNKKFHLKELNNLCIEMNETSKSPETIKFISSNASNFLCCIESDKCLHKLLQNSTLFKNELITNYEQLRKERDEDGRSVFHLVSNLQCNCEACQSRSGENLRLLLSKNKNDINLDLEEQDNEGNTPLHLAIMSRNLKCTKELISSGAKLFTKNKKGKDALSLIANNAPEEMISVMDQSIQIEKNYPNSKNCEISLDFRSIIGLSKESNERKFSKELTLLTKLLSSQKSLRHQIFSHALVQAFLFKKWEKVRKYFVLIFFLYLIWLLSFTSFIIKVYLVKCPCRFYSKENMKLELRGNLNRERPIMLNDEKGCLPIDGIIPEAFFLLFLSLMMFLNELGKIVAIPKLYFRNHLNIVKWFLLGMVMVTTVPVLMERKNKSLEPWQYQAASLAIFVSWANILVQLAKFPSLGKYTEMLGHVLKNFGLSILTFSSLFMAFALSFNILFPGNNPFSNFFYAMVKVLVMMAGELDYSDTFYDDNDDSVTGPLIGHILYAAFIIIITIVLMNLLIGLTVSDIQKLQKEAELTRVFRQISFISSLEGIVFSGRLKTTIGNLFQKRISVTKSTTDSKSFRIRPNDMSDKCLPEKLKLRLLEIATRNYHHHQ